MEGVTFLSFDWSDSIPVLGENLFFYEQAGTRWPPLKVFFILLSVAVSAAVCQYLFRHQLPTRPFSYRI